MTHAPADETNRHLGWETGPSFQVISDGFHLWFIETSPTLGGIQHFSLMHHGPGMDKNLAVQATVIDQFPEAMAASDASVYMVFRGKLDQTTHQMLSRTIATIRAAAFIRISGLWQYEPDSRAWLRAELPGDGVLAGFTAVDDNLYALMRFSPVPQQVGPSSAPPRPAHPSLDAAGKVGAEGSDKAEAAADAAAVPPPTGYVLQRLKLSSWENVPLPAIFTGSEQGEINAATLWSGPLVTLVVERSAAEQSAAGHDGKDISSSITTMYQLQDDGSWSATPLDFHLTDIISETTYQGQIFILSQSSSHQSQAGAPSADNSEAASSPNLSSSIGQIYLVRGGRLYPAGKVDLSLGRGRLMVFDHQLQIAMYRQGAPGIFLTPFDLLTGREGKTERYGARLTPRMDDYRLFVLISGLVIASLIIYVFRPAEPKLHIVIPANRVVAKPGRRAQAILIDMFAASLITWSLLGTDLGDILNPFKYPMFATRWKDVWPAACMLLLTVGHETVCEMIWAKSLGKALMNCCVQSIDGSKPRVVQILGRNVMKLLDLALPPLFLFVYLNPYRQRLGDIVGRTIVVTTRPDAPATDGDAARQTDRTSSIDRDSSSPVRNDQDGDT